MLTPEATLPFQLRPTFNPLPPPAAGLSGEIFVARGRMPSGRPHNFYLPVAGLVPATHVLAVHFADGQEGVDGRAKPGQGDPALCKQRHAQPRSVPRTALRLSGERVRVRGSFRYDRIKPSISLSAQLIASSTDWRCWVTLAINFVNVAWANICVPILSGAG